MAKANVLYLHVTGVSSEILKNLVLAGIRATLCDNRTFPDAVSDTPSFLLPPSAVTTTSSASRRDGVDDDSPPATKRAKKQQCDTVGRALKPVVEDLNLLLGECQVIDKDVSALDAEELSRYPIVVASRIGETEAKRVAAIVTNAGNQFFMADCFGLHGASVADLGHRHQYRPEQGKKLLDPVPLEPHLTLEEIFATPLDRATNRFHKTHPPPVWMRYRTILEYHRQTQSWPSADKADHFVEVIQAWIRESSPVVAQHEVFTEASLTQLAKTATAEIAPTCAVLGGMVGNEVIKAISGKGQPANNTVLFDGDTCKCWSFLVKPKE